MTKCPTWTICPSVPKLQLQLQDFKIKGINYFLWKWCMNSWLMAKKCMFLFAGLFTVTLICGTMFASSWIKKKSLCQIWIKSHKAEIPFTALYIQTSSWKNNASGTVYTRLSIGGVCPVWSIQSADMHRVFLTCNLFFSNFALQGYCTKGEVVIFLVSIDCTLYEVSSRI